jgi:hypothetical protein
VLGICKLTGKSGKFIRSHLIPQALTKPSVPGNFFISGGPGRRTKKTWSSWYDEELVVQEGEDILAKYDNWAVPELRRLELVWSGWGAKTALPISNWARPTSSIPEVARWSAAGGLRTIECAHPEKLRLFFLSLLWRAAATTRPDFRDVALDVDDLELLRTMIITANPRPFDFYPTTLFQIVTRGWPHNLGPIADKNWYRFYFDGLHAYMLRNFRGRDVEKWKSVVGVSPQLVVQTQTFEQSYQRANIIQHQRESALLWPGAVKKLTTPRQRKGR